MKFFYILLIPSLFSCNYSVPKQNHSAKNIQTSPKDFTAIKNKNIFTYTYYSFLDSVNCTQEKEEYRELKLNGLQVSTITKKKWMIDNPKYDSIVDNNIYYGRSSVFIDKSGLATFTIRDNGLRLFPFGELYVSSISLAKKYPCCYKSIELNELDGVAYYSFEIFDSKFNKLRYYVNDNKVIAIAYFAEEEMP